MNAAPNPNKIVVFSGAGLSKASGLPTFPDSHGLWQQYDVWQLASPSGFTANPELVHQFYQQRRLTACAATPNAAHLAIAALEQKYKMVVGCSLEVEPRASVLRQSRKRAEKHFVDTRAEHCPIGFYLWQGEAVVQVPLLINSWLSS